ncbi:MAG TPA: serine hydrolase, partial [Anaerolineaceae bacterium]
LKMFETPANKRTDINTGPDVYDQTTPEDLGLLLEDIYACATNNGGALIAAFPGQITQEKCKLMIEYLSNNNINQLIQAGVPAGTVVAHKHGWAVETDGVIHTMGNAALIYTPGGNYILSIFVHDDNQVLFNPANQMVAELSRAVYNYFNVPSQ